MIAIICVSSIAGFLIGICLGEKTIMSDVTISKVLEIIGEVYDNSMTFKIQDYDELCKRVKELSIDEVE